MLKIRLKQMWEKINIYNKIKSKSNKNQNINLKTAL